MSDLQKENDELRAKVEIMAKLGSDMADELQANYNNQQTRLMSMKWYKEIDSSNSQSLADIKAEAVREAGEFIRDRFKPSNEDEHLSHIEIDQMLVNYANRIKEGEENDE